jgi:hypothetical protein
MGLPPRRTYAYSCRLFVLRHLVPHVISRGAPHNATWETPIIEGWNYGREMGGQFGLWLRLPRKSQGSFTCRVVSWQRDVDWACVLYDRHIHSDWASRLASSRQCTYPFHSSLAGFFFWQSITSPRSISRPTAQIWLPATYSFSQS